MPFQILLSKAEVPPLKIVDDILVPVTCDNKSKMVDDILVSVTCENKSFLANVKVISFMESKKLKLNDKKCHKMHLVKTNSNCPSLKVHSS